MLFGARVDMFQAGHTFFVSQWLLGRDLDEMNENCNDFGAWYVNLAGLESYEIIALGKLYVECNKKNIYLLANPWTKQTDGNWYFNPTVFGQYLGNPTTWPENLADPVTPLKDKKWPSSDGPKTRTKSDFSGASGLYAAWLALPDLVKRLRADGRARDAGIVQFAYDEVRLGSWSITKALLYIGKNVVL